MGDMAGLIDSIQESIIDQDAMMAAMNADPDDPNAPALDPTSLLKGEHKGMFGNLMSGKFSLRDLYSMFGMMRGYGLLTFFAHVLSLVRVTYTYLVNFYFF